MLSHSIWAAGLLGHLILVAVLLKTGRARRFPAFTLLILFDALRALALALVLGRLAPDALHSAITAFEITDLLLEYAVLAELIFTALRPLHGFRRATLPLLLLASGVVIVGHLAPVRHYTGRTIPLLLHFLLGVLLFEWAVVLALLLRPLRLRVQSGVAAISFGFGVYAAALLFAGGYFRVGRDMSDYIFFSHLRIAVYLLVVLWWILTLWKPDREPAPGPE